MSVVDNSRPPRCVECQGKEVILTGYGKCKNCGRNTNKQEDKMRFGYNNTDDYREASSMLENYPDYGSRAFYENDSMDYNGLERDLIRNWLYLLEVGILEKEAELDKETIQWLKHNLDLAFNEFPAEKVSRLAKENAALLKEAEDLEAKAKQLREKVIKSQ